MNSRSRRRARVWVGVTLLFVLRPVFPAGFYLPEVGTPASIGTAGVANPTNTYTADACWTNPAGMTGVPESSLLAGLMIAAPRIEFESSIADAGGSDGGNAGQAGGIPGVFFTTKLSERTRFGVSITAPFGGGLDYGDDFVGRYAIQSVSLAGLALTPAFAYKLSDRWSIGVGASVVYTTLEQEIAVRRLLSGQPDGKAKFEDLDDTGFQGIFGLTWKASEHTLVGLVYRSQAGVDLEGKLKFENLGVPIADRDVRIQWDNPQWAEIGVRHEFGGKRTLFFNAGWQEWSEFSENELSVADTGIVDITDRNWDNTWQAGVAYAQRFEGGGYYALGLSHESSPVDDQDRTFDFPVDEQWKVSGAYGWSPGRKLAFAVGATLYLIGDAPIDQTEQGVRVVGKYDSNMNLMVGGTLRYVF